jgi:NADPH:quinone reductase-like Zn-dependent oxidoreductase
MLVADGPSDAFQINFGLLVDAWPMVIGADGVGVVVELGSNAEKFGWSVGDHVIGCNRLGVKGHGSAAEFFLKDARTTMKKPSNLTLEQAASVGAGTQTAADGLYTGLGVAEPAEHGQEEKKNSWILVFGGAGNVGRAAVQLALLAGYGVVATCSERSKKDLESLGAKTVDYHLSEDEQVRQILELTDGGHLRKAFDATSSENPAVAKAVFKQIQGDKLFATTNDWAGPGDFEGGKTFEIGIGPMGSPAAEDLNARMAKFNPMIVRLFEAGKLTAPEVEVVGQGLNDVPKAYEYQSAGKGGSKKVLVKIQDE